VVSPSPSRRHLTLDLGYNGCNSARGFGFLERGLGVPCRPLWMVTWKGATVGPGLLDRWSWLNTLHRSILTLPFRPQNKSELLSVRPSSQDSLWFLEVPYLTSILSQTPRTSHVKLSAASRGTCASCIALAKAVYIKAPYTGITLPLDLFELAWPLVAPRHLAVGPFSPAGFEQAYHTVHYVPYSHPSGVATPLVAALPLKLETEYLHCWDQAVSAYQGGQRTCKVIDL